MERYEDLKFWGGYFVNFLKLGTSLKIFFKFQGPNRQIWDGGLIYKMSRDLFVHFPGLWNSLIVFKLENPWTRSTSHEPRPKARSTIDHTTAQTRGHRGVVARSPKLSLRLLQGSEARQWGLGTEMGGWRTQLEAHPGVRSSEEAER
jgi:hypothetical protein